MADGLLLAVLAALPAALFAGPLSRGEIPYFMDTLMYFVPLRVQAARLLAQGEWPLWNRCLMGGVPLFENPQAALAYPPHWPFLNSAGGVWFTLPLLAHLGLWAALTFWALRRMAVGRGPALLGGALTLAGSYGWSRLQFGNFMNVLPWLPLWLGSAQAFAASAGPFWLLAGAAAVAFAVLAGAHQLAAYGLAGLALYALAQVALARGRRLRWAVFLLLTMGFGVALAAPGWLPQLGFIKETARPQGLAKDEVLAGTLGSWGDVARALAGDWNLVKARPAAPWSDAESSAAIGLAALALAALPPRRRGLRRAWAGCWLAGLAGILLSLRVVMAPLLDHWPQAGIFHDPRRWLGLSQWMLVLAAALSAASLRDYAAESGQKMLRALARLVPGFVVLGAVAGAQWRGAPRYTAANAALAALLLILVWVARLRGARVLFGVLLAGAAGLLGHATWVTTDMKTVALEPLLHPRDSLLDRAGLIANQRFFTLDWRRDSSYDYTRPDLAQAALPNLACLWGLEDLGGYEPAQSERYRAFIAQAHAAEPWRRVAPSHFGLIGEPLAAAALDEGNVHFALFPRWGVPAYYFMPGTEPGTLLTAYPRGLTRNFQVRALVYDAESAAPLTMLVQERNNTWRYPLTPPHPLGPGDDLAASTTTYGGVRPEAPLAASVRAEGAELPPQFEGPRPWLLSQPRRGRVLGVYYWNQDFDALWEPVAMGRIATLMRYRGNPRWTSWSRGEGEVVIRKLGANRVVLDARVTSAATAALLATSSTLVSQAPAAPGTARLVIHDAYWPGWRATVDGRPAALQAAGLWRALDLEAGSHTIEMRYEPPAVADSFKIAAEAGGTLLVLCVLAWLARALAARASRARAAGSSRPR